MEPYIIRDYCLLILMTKQKPSFFERLTGAQHVSHDDFEGSVPISSQDEEENIPMENTNEHFQPLTTPKWSQPSFQHIEHIAEPEIADGSEGQLTIDVYQTENDIVIKSTIAGVKPEDLDVSINNDMVTVKGERRNEESVEGGNYYYQECYWGGFSRSVLLPVDVIPEKADASLKNGILTIRLPKADTTKTKKIQVRGF